MSSVVTRPQWWGGKRHVVFTVAVFVILASLDNAAIGVLPPLYPVIAEGFSVSEVSIGFVTALNILIIAIAAPLWGYWGDRGRRKRLLLYGTGIWSVATLLSGASQNVLQFLAFQVITAVGLGCVASVGFSIMTDFISPRRRGLVMSLWGLSQGVGTGGGLLLGGLLGAHDWRLPFFVIAGAGLVFAVLYVFTYEPQRGRTQPELSDVFSAGREYAYRIVRTDIPRLLTRRSNIWLILQGFTARLAYGSLIWLPRLFASKVEAQGYTLETATVVGSTFAVLFQVGGVFSVAGGHLGDLWQRRDPRGRAMLCAIGITGAIPLYLVLFFLPIRGVAIPEPAGTATIVWAVLKSLFTNGWIMVTFLVALGALALTSVDSPNWFALITDVNMPEHRGTVWATYRMGPAVPLATD